MALVSGFFRLRFWLTCLLAFCLEFQLVRPALSAPAPAADLSPCTGPAPLVTSLTAGLPPAVPVTPENNPDPSASPPGDMLTRLEEGLAQLVRAARPDGVTSASVVIKDSFSGQVLQTNQAQVYPSASLYKVFLLWKVQREIDAGRLSEDTLIPLVLYSEETFPKEDTVPAPSDQTISVGEARRLMITMSDNTAAWSLAKIIGWGPVDSLLDSRNFMATRLNTPTPVTTAGEMARFFEGLYRQALDPALDESDYALMLDLFKAQQINFKLSAGLPRGITFAHKTGSLDDVNHDAGIIYTPDGRAIFIAVLTQGDFDASQALLRQVAAFTWENLGRKPLPVFFPATGKTLSGRFLEYWQDQGGLPSFGLPINDPRLELNRATGTHYLSQWFERARFEFHPENLNTPYEVLLGLLGSELCGRALHSDPRFKPAPPIVGPPNSNRFIFFPQTGHNLGNGFLNYWQRNGGLARYGLPISEEHRELNPATGQVYTVQWFERARFEWHSENAGTPYEILLGLLGSEYISLKPG